MQDYFKQTFQSGLSKLFKRVGVIFPLISSRGKLSSPPITTDEDESDALTVFLGTADVPWNKTNKQITKILILGIMILHRIYIPKHNIPQMGSSHILCQEHSAVQA